MRYNSLQRGYSSCVTGPESQTRARRANGNTQLEPSQARLQPGDRRTGTTEHQHSTEKPAKRNLTTLSEKDLLVPRQKDLAGLGMGPP
eukprot:1741615-Rhodomonas_salina.1